MFSMRHYSNVLKTKGIWLISARFLSIQIQLSVLKKISTLTLIHLNYGQCTQSPEVLW